MPPRQTGSVAINLRGGAQSEILAQALFTMFGTAVLVPRQDDYGVDLLCTLLSDRKGRRAWPIAYYAVQVKSDTDPWVFPSRRSVEWVVGYPAALLLCVVNKAERIISIYHTLARFAAATAPELPETLAMRPEGRGSEFTGAYGYNPETDEYLLGPPIVQLTVAELVDEDSIQRMRAVLQAWLELDYRNVIKYQIGLRTVELPLTYRTGEIPVVDTAIELAWAPEHARATGERTAIEALRWLVTPWVHDGDYRGTLLGLLLLRHKDPTGKIPSVLLLALANKARFGPADSLNQRALLARLNEATADIAKLSAKLNEDIARFLAELVLAEPTVIPANGPSSPEYVIGRLMCDAVLPVDVRHVV
jgi:hypothetical protein